MFNCSICTIIEMGCGPSCCCLFWSHGIPNMHKRQMSCVFITNVCINGMDLAGLYVLTYLSYMPSCPWLTYHICLAVPDWPIIYSYMPSCPWLTYHICLAVPDRPIIYAYLSLTDLSYMPSCPWLTYHICLAVPNWPIIYALLSLTD